MANFHLRTRTSWSSACIGSLSFGGHHGFSNSGADRIATVGSIQQPIERRSVRPSPLMPQPLAVTCDVPQAGLFVIGPASTGRLRDPHHDLEHKLYRFGYVLGKFGITSCGLGVTAHGFGTKR